MTTYSRRTVAKSLAWTVPAVVVAATVPHAAASEDPCTFRAEPVVLCCDPSFLEVRVINPPCAAGAVRVTAWRDAGGVVWPATTERVLTPNTAAAVSFVGGGDCAVPRGEVLWTSLVDDADGATPVDLSEHINEDCRV